MGNEKEYTINFKAMPEDIQVFDPTEASLAEDLFDEDLFHDSLIFEAGLTEAVRRLLRKHDDYGLLKYVRSILDAEYEGEKKVE